MQEFSNDLDLFVKSIVDPVTVDRTPIRSKKKARQNTNDANASTRLDATQTSNTSLANASTCRPSRQAATKALAGLKEPTLNVKLRNEGPVPVKLERVSLHNAQQRLATKENDNPNRPNTPTEELTQKARKMSLHETPARAAPTPMDESLIVMPAKQMDVVTLSDGDDEPAAAPAVESVASTALDPALMPPPSKPAPVTRKPRTKRNIKSEKLSLVAAPAVPDEPQRSTRSKKPHGVPKPMEIVKAEPLGDAMPMELQSDASPVCVDSSPEHASTESPEPVFDRNEGVPATANATIESVYEDARADELPRTSEALPPYTEEPMDAQSAGDETAQPIEAAVREALPQPMDATYVQPADANITYAAVVCNTTYVAPAAAAGNETFQVPAAVAAGNETVCLGPAPGKTDAVSSTNKARSSSLMTDDISDEDEIPLSRMPTLKTKHKELFK